MAGSSYSTKCATAGMIFSKNAVIFESRAAGTNLVSKHTSGGYQSYSFTLHENMTELYCADRIWETHQELWSEPIKINVTKRSKLYLYLFHIKDALFETNVTNVGSYNL